MVKWVKEMSSDKLIENMLRSIIIVAIGAACALLASVITNPSMELVSINMYVGGKLLEYAGVLLALGTFSIAIYKFVKFSEFSINHK